MDRGLLEPKNEEEIVARRKRLNDNVPLKEIFSMFWMVLSLESEDGDVIFKDQFVHFLYLLQSALLGPSNVSEKEAIIIGEKEFFHNLSYYGECGQFAFNDIMAECIECWADVESPSLYPAYAWSLFSAIVNFSGHIPSFIEQRKIKRIPSGHSMEKDISVNYYKDKNHRMKILKVVKWSTENPQIDREASRRLKTRRSGLSYEEDDTQNLFDMFTLYQHILDLEASKKQATNMGRISPGIKSRRAFNRSTSLAHDSKSIIKEEDTRNGSDADESTVTSIISSEMRPVALKNVFQQSKTNLLLQPDPDEDSEVEKMMSRADSLPDADTPRTSPPHMSIEGSKPSAMKSEEILGDTKAPAPTQDNSAKPVMRTPHRSIPKSKKREILVKRDSNVANGMKLDPEELTEKEREAFELNRNTRHNISSGSDADVEGDADEGGRNFLSRQSSSVSVSSVCSVTSPVFSRQNSLNTPPAVLSRQNTPPPKRCLSRSGSSVASQPSLAHSPPPTHSYSRQKSTEKEIISRTLSRSTSSINDIVFPDEDAVVSIPAIPENPKIVSAYEKSLRPRPQRPSTMTPGDMLVATRSDASLLAHSRSIATPLSQEEVVMESVSGEPSVKQLDSKDVANDCQDEHRPDQIYSQREKENSLLSRGNSEHVHDQTIDDNSIAVSADDQSSFMSKLDVGSLGEADNDDSTVESSVMEGLQLSPYSPQVSVSNHQPMNSSMDGREENMSPYYVRDLPVGLNSSIDPCLLKKYSHFVDQYLTELPENIPVLPPRISQKRKVKVVVKVTPKMAIAKEVAERKKLTRNILQDKKYVKDTRVLASKFVKKRGQTPMQRKVAIRPFIPTAPGKYAVPCEDMEADKLNIEHFMLMLLKNSRLKSGIRKTGLASIAVDMGIMRGHQGTHATCEGDNMPDLPRQSQQDFSRNEKEKSVTALVSDHMCQEEKQKREQQKEQDTRKVLDLFNMKKGLIRCSYINLVNSEGLPEFVYISRQGPNALSKRISNGADCVTEWDKFEIILVNRIDSHIHGSISPSTSDHTCTLKQFMSGLLELQSPCSKEQRYRLLSEEFSIPSLTPHGGDKECGHVDEWHVLGEIYRKRERLIKRVIKDTADILQKDIDAKGKSQAEATTSSPPTTEPNQANSSSLPDIDAHSNSVASEVSLLGGESAPNSPSHSKSVISLSRSKRWTKSASATSSVQTFISKEKGAQVKKKMKSTRASFGSNGDGSSISSTNMVGRMDRLLKCAEENSSVGAHSSSGSVSLGDSSQRHCHSQPSVSASCDSLPEPPRKLSLPLVTRTVSSAFNDHSATSSYYQNGHYHDHSFFTEVHVNDSTGEVCPLQTKRLLSARPHSALDSSVHPQNTLSFYKENTANCDDALYYHNDSPYIPWVPKGGMKLMTSDRKDVCDGWRERREVASYVDTTKSSSVLRRTTVVRDSFESFSKANPHFCAP